MLRAEELSAMLDMTWQGRAACRHSDPDLFFPVGRSREVRAGIAAAKQACARCPVVSACLEWALESEQHSGVWGGMSELELRLERGRRARSAG